MYFYFFFFFKQKTAYEMRISDWSSDVCSSDLPEVRNRLVLMPADIVAGEEQVSGSGLEDKNLSADLETTLDEGRSSWVDSRGLRSLRQSDADPAHTHGPCVCTSTIITVRRVKIGRASCRERVCHNVERPVVA